MEINLTKYFKQNLRIESIVFPIRHPEARKQTQCLEKDIFVFCSHISISEISNFGSLFKYRPPFFFLFLMHYLRLNLSLVLPNPSSFPLTPNPPAPVHTKLFWSFYFNSFMHPPARFRWEGNLYVYLKSETLAKFFVIQDRYRYHGNRKVNTNIGLCATWLDF